MSAIVRPRAMRTRLVLAALCAALIGIIYLEAGWSGLDARAPVAATQDQAAPPAQGDDATFAMPPLDSLSEVVKRPLFSEQRRPPAIAAAAAADARSTGFTLVGIVMAPGGGLALIEHGQPPHLDRVHERQEIDGWTVEQIARDRVTLRHADDRIEIKIKDAPSRQPGAPNGPAFVMPPPNSNVPAHFVGTGLPAHRQEN